MGERPKTTADAGEFRFRAGRPSLDLCSTLLWRLCEPVEQLVRGDDLARWVVAAGLVDAAPAVTVDDVESARVLREAMYRLFCARIAGGHLPARDVDVINRVAARPDPAPRLTRSGRRTRTSSDPVRAALSAVARDGIDLLTGDLSARIRQCAAPDCAFVFVDTSRPGTRQWCSTSRCGNRERVRTFRTRHAPAEG